MWRTLPAAALLLLTVPGGWALAEGQTAYTWKDAAGRVHYGNRPPEGQSVTPVLAQPTERIYTWTDADGKIHYGPQPPPDTPAKELHEENGSLSTIRSSQLREGERRLLPPPPADSPSRP